MIHCILLLNRFPLPTTLLKVSSVSALYHGTMIRRLKSFLPVQPMLLRMSLIAFSAFAFRTPANDRSFSGSVRLRF
jgi:hypothetical protein